MAYTTQVLNLWYLPKKIWFASSQCEFKFEYLGEFEDKLESNLGYELEDLVVTFDEKNQRLKISCYSFSKVASGI